MAEQPVVPPDITPAMFFEQLMPAGFQAQVEQGLPAPKDYRIQYKLTGAGGGEWNVAIHDGRMDVTRGDWNRRAMKSPPCAGVYPFRDDLRQCGVAAAS